GEMYRIFCVALGGIVPQLPVPRVKCNEWFCRMSVHLPNPKGRARAVNNIIICGSDGIRA
ncbi:MAG: hypothetical protein V4516_17205, partial [Pseudomonadota bacterium]